MCEKCSMTSWGWSASFNTWLVMLSGQAAFLRTAVNIVNGSWKTDSLLRRSNGYGLTCCICGIFNCSQPLCCCVFVWLILSSTSKCFYLSWLLSPHTDMSNSYIVNGQEQGSGSNTNCTIDHRNIESHVCKYWLDCASERMKRILI